jgi:phosphoglycerate dehydrogenase-like enzyme
MSRKRIAAFIGDPANIARVYGHGRRDRVAELTDLRQHIVTVADFHAPTDLSQVEAFFSTWGMPALSPDDLDQLSAIRVIFYAGGTVQAFARPLLERGITVVSAWHANAVPVAEFTLSQILLSMKNYWTSSAAARSPEGWGQPTTSPGAFGETVALLGAGAVGRVLIRLLAPVQLKIIVFDPFLAEDEAVALGVRKTSLDEAFRTAYVVSNHLADKPETKHLLKEEHFAAMRDGATFINTGRGATVDEAALARVLAARPSLTALLDVTAPEPPVAGSPLYALPNVHLTPHIAGAIGDEVLRMADLCIEQFIAWDAGAPLSGAVTLPMLNQMA